MSEQDFTNGQNVDAVRLAQIRGILTEEGASYEERLSPDLTLAQLREVVARQCERMRKRLKELGFTDAQVSPGSAAEQEIGIEVDCSLVITPLTEVWVCKIKIRFGWFST